MKKLTSILSVLLAIILSIGNVSLASAEEIHVCHHEWEPIVETVQVSENLKQYNITGYKCIYCSEETKNPRGVMEEMGEEVTLILKANSVIAVPLSGRTGYTLDSYGYATDKDKKLGDSAGITGVGSFVGEHLGMIKVPSATNGTIRFKVTEKNGSITDTWYFNIRGCFNDVQDESLYFFAPVYWAAQNGITTGRSGGLTFDPNATCTRAEIVAFLWRLAGKPTVSCENPFSDISKDAYYYNAVLWAYNNGITTGRRGGEMFDPNGTCTRREIVTFLWRYVGKPTPKSMDSKFTDIKDSSAYYYKAVLWAVEQGITTGKKATNYTTFDPLGECTRAMSVTFIYRYAN